MPFACNSETESSLQASGLSYDALCNSCDATTVQTFLDSGLTLAQAAAICSVTGETRNSMDTLFIVLVAAIVFLMHAGFGMLCAGAVRTKNTLNILLQTVLDACITGICFYLVGYGMAFGESSKGNNGFIGVAGFGLAEIDEKTDWRTWLLAWAFAATATTIPAGSVAERFSFVGYIVYSFFISAWVYPLVAHWVWSDYGWLSAHKTNPLLGSGMIDYAGCSVVHMVGGLAGTMGAFLAGPRIGRFDRRGNPVSIHGHSATLVVLGTFLLWFGWYGFNPGSGGTIAHEYSATVMARTAVTTTLGGCAGGITSLLWAYFKNGTWDLSAVCNGVLVGLVSVTASCSVIEAWAALIAGSIGAIVFDVTCTLYLKGRIDDPLSAGPMHGVCGAWGALFVGLLAKKEYILQVVNGGEDSDRSYGLLYGGGGQLLACQVIGVIVIGAWVLGLMGACFLILSATKLIRITPEEEMKGLDLSKHGGSAYYSHHHESDRGPRTHPLELPLNDESWDKING